MDAVGTTSSVSRDSEPISDDLSSCQFIESHTPTPSTFSAHVRRILPHVQGRVHRKIRRKIRLSLPVVIPLSENCTLFKRGVQERLSEDFSKSLRNIGWEAGIRTPIRRSRVWKQISILLVCFVLSRTLPHGFARFSALNVAMLLPSFPARTSLRMGPCACTGKCAKSSGILRLCT